MDYSHRTESFYLSYKDYKVGNVGAMATRNLFPEKLLGGTLFTNQTKGLILFKPLSELQTLKYFPIN